MGLSLAGFTSNAVVEWDKNACNTLRLNKENGHPLAKDWNVFEGDVRNFDFTPYVGKLDLLAGGPPCQPFSIGGKSRAYADERNMFPAMINAVRILKPRAFIVENVKGLTRRSFANYFSYTLLQLRYPDVVMGEGEQWLDHLARLERLKTSGWCTDYTYDLVWRVVNAADYGIPQCRERIFIVGFRHDQNAKWAFPDPEYSQDALIYSQRVSGEYLDKHRISKNRLSPVTAALQKKIDALRDNPPQKKPWRTVRDALADLPRPGSRGAGLFPNNNFQPGAKIYTGHTGSVLDMPCKTIKAGAHGVPGGENMLILDDGTPRYLSVRESARIQTFPDTYVFTGSSWGEAMRQIGNAVPVKLAQKVASSVGMELLSIKAKAMRASHEEA